MKTAKKTLVLESATAKTAQKTAHLAEHLEVVAKEARHLKKAGKAESVIAKSLGKEKGFLKTWKAKREFSASLKGKGNRAGKELYKAFRNEALSETEIRILLKEAGFKPPPRPKGIPKDWKVKLSDKGGGMKYVHPKDSGTYTRVMPGNPNSKNPWQRKPYVSTRKNGQALDKTAKVVAETSKAAHIPIEEYVFLIVDNAL